MSVKMALIDEPTIGRLMGLDAHDPRSQIQKSALSLSYWLRSYNVRGGSSLSALPVLCMNLSITGRKVARLRFGGADNVQASATLS